MAAARIRYRMVIFMRLPNGYGSITKLSGKRRNPYMVRITSGVNADTGDYIRKVLGYYSKRADALQALAAYHKAPYDLNAHPYTFQEVYDFWSEQHYKTLSDSAVRSYKTAYKTCSPLHSLPFREIRLKHLQEFIDCCGKSQNSKARMKNLISMMYTYALRHEITDKDYAKHIELGKSEGVQNPHQPFTAEEIQTLWAHVGKLAFSDTVLILIYTGMRAGELLNMRIENIHLKERYMIGGSKTDAGRNRVIPINEKIFPLIRARAEAGRIYLIEPYMSYKKYSRYFEKLMENLGMTRHRTHDGRHTFASLMDSAGANETAMKTIMGHAGGDLTSKVYIHKSLPELLKNVNLI